MGAMQENSNQNKGIESGCDAEEPKIKNEGIESGCNAKEPESKQRDRIWARCPRTRNKTKGSNLGLMLENPKQKEGIESGHDVGEPETKERDRIWAQC